MSAFQFGVIVGGFLAYILLPVIVLIICNFVPAAKRKPKVVYSICEVLVVSMALLTIKGGGDPVFAAIAAMLAGLFLTWGYRRAEKKLRTADSAQKALLL